MLLDAFIYGMAAMVIAVIAMLLAGTYTTAERVRIPLRYSGYDTQEIRHTRSGRSQGWTSHDPAFPSQTSIALRARLRAQARYNPDHRTWESWFERPSRRDHSHC